MKVKLDENMPASAAEVLITAGLDVDTVTSEGLAGATDRGLLDAATADGRMLITLDRGLGDVRSYPPGSHPGIVVLRLPDQSAAASRAALSDLVASYDLASLAGAVTVMEHGLLRVRRWPGS